MEYLKVKNWENFQHYTDRDPPWIKLHFSTLSSETWVMLDDANRVLAIACMLIASRNKGRVPNNASYVRRVAYLNADPEFKYLIDIGFLEVASTSKQTQANVTTEERREEERQTRKHPSVEEVIEYCKQRKNNVDPQKWFDYYTSNGWKVGKNSMKDWKAAVRTWERNNYDNKTTKEISYPRV